MRGSRTIYIQGTRHIRTGLACRTGGSLLRVDQVWRATWPRCSIADRGCEERTEVLRPSACNGAQNDQQWGGTSSIICQIGAPACQPDTDWSTGRQRFSLPIKHARSFSSAPQSYFDGGCGRTVVQYSVHGSGFICCLGLSYLFNGKYWRLRSGISE